MKRFLAIALTAAMGLVASNAFAVADAGYTTADAANGIGGSRHNLGAFGKHVITANLSGVGSGLTYNTTNYTAVTGTTEICVFCHTPHHSATGSGPLWNKGVQTGTVTGSNIVTAVAYTAYTSSWDSTHTLNSDGIQPCSLACLSCHDGTSTLDTLVNAPGKGNSGVNNKTVTNFGWYFSEDGVSKIDYLTSNRLNVGTDLRNDHPVSVVYSTSYASLRPTDTTISAIDLTAGLVATTANITQNLWAVQGTFKAAGTIADILKNGRVECSSCHDPHFSNKSWDETESTWLTAGGMVIDESEVDGLFLRRNGGNTGSGVCRTCHNK